MYEESTDYVYIHGGMSYHDDDIKPSNRTYALRPGGTPVWDYMETHPADKHIVSGYIYIFNTCSYVPKKKITVTITFPGEVFTGNGISYFLTILRGGGFVARKFLRGNFFL